MQAHSSKPGTRKRKAEDKNTSEDGVNIGKQAKRPRTGTKSNSKGKGKGKARPEWPEYFESLFKVFKALNTVLAFVSSRKQLATTFPVVRSSVERLLKQPLDMSQVAELKALLPHLIEFAYTPANQLRIHADSSLLTGKGGYKNFDFLPRPSYTDSPESEEHVLILEFREFSKGNVKEIPGSYTLPPAMSPAAAKKLIEKRNGFFSEAVDELILATPKDEDPVDLLKSAGRDHIPVDSNHTTEKESTFIPAPEDRPSVDSVISEITEQEWYSEQISARRTFEAKEGRLGNLDPPLSPNICQALKESRNITSLYIHQVQAIDALMQGRHVIVSTSTASGKSVIYQVPLLRFLEEDPKSTAIFIYPTKALAQDQKAAVEQLLCACPGLEHIKVATYDGDTPQEKRREIRETASIIFTNFDMIHASILPHEDLWRSFLQSIKLVAVDELHYYSDLFGSHVAQVMRRFRRICAAVGNRRIRFVSCSATISKPMQHMKNIFGVEDIVEVMEDGAPSGRKDFLVWDPPKILDDRKSRNSGPIPEAIGLMIFLMKRGIRVILFCKIRKICELAMKQMRTELGAQGRLDVLKRVKSYRGGYSPEDRRRIEAEAFSGSILGLIATNALELGVDIGVLDAVIMLGFPVRIASFRQQAGRAGRRARDSLVVLVADNLPIDQHYATNPDELFEKPTDDLVVDLENSVILEAHLQCAGHEMPLSPEDSTYFGPMTRELCDTRLTKDKDGWYHTHPKYLPYPAKFVALRGAQEDRYVIIDVSKLGKPGGTAKILEEIEISRALFEVYEGGVFIHQGLTFIVKEVDHDSKTARIIRADVNWITSPRDVTDANPVQTHRIREIKGSPMLAFYGRVEVKTRVYGFYKIRNNIRLDRVDLETPVWERESTGMWIDIPKDILQIFRETKINLAAAIHSAQHAYLNKFGIGGSLKTECKVPDDADDPQAVESQGKRPARLIFYDLVGKGGGVAARAFDQVSDILHQTEESLGECKCEAGCSNCIFNPSCRYGTEASCKEGARLLLRCMLGLEVETDAFIVPNKPDVEQMVVEAECIPAIDGVRVESA